MSFKAYLSALQSNTLIQIDIRISEDMAGVTNWRQWLEDTLGSADVFVLLYPNAFIDMNWSNYELGRFYDGKRKIVCVKNTDIPKPPSPFQPYRAYDGDEVGIQRFITELFPGGTFTDNKPLNHELEHVARELAQQFRQARFRDTRFWDEASRFFDLQLERLPLSEYQIQQQDISGLKDSLTRIDDALHSPDAFGVVRLNVTGSGSVYIVQSNSDYMMQIGILPLLLERKKLIIDRIRNQRSQRPIENVTELIDSLSDAELREKLRTEFEAAKQTSAVANRIAAIHEGYAFVAMAMSPNDPTLEDILDAIKEGASRCGIKAERIDESLSNEPITQRMLLSIQAAEYVIAELTTASTNVFYEAGYAHGLGKIPIYVARVGANIPFDVKDYPVIYYPNMRELKSLLAERLQAVRVGRK
jgi:hypothetical protein